MTFSASACDRPEYIRHLTRHRNISGLVSGVEEYRLIGGKGDGMRLLQVRNGLGLEFTVSPDRAADITRLSYGIPFGIYMDHLTLKILRKGFSRRMLLPRFFTGDDRFSGCLLYTSYISFPASPSIRIIV